MCSCNRRTQNEYLVHVLAEYLVHELAEYLMHESADLVHELAEYLVHVLAAGLVKGGFYSFPNPRTAATRILRVRPLPIIVISNDPPR